MAKRAGKRSKWKQRNLSNNKTVRSSSSSSTTTTTTTKTYIYKYVYIFYTFLHDIFIVCCCFFIGNFLICFAYCLSLSCLLLTTFIYDYFRCFVAIIFKHFFAWTKRAQLPNCRIYLLCVVFFTLLSFRFQKEHENENNQIKNNNRNKKPISQFCVRYKYVDVRVQLCFDLFIPVYNTLVCTNDKRMIIDEIVIKSLDSMKRTELQ